MHPELHMTRQVYDQICNTIGRRPPESGGILGSSDGGKTIDRFYFDATAKVTGGTYSPDTEVINRVLAHWDTQDILLVGFVHSHPKGYAKPSEGDYRYVKAIMSALNITDDFFMPIVIVNDPPDGKINLYAYTFRTDILLEAQPLGLLEDYAADPILPSLRTHPKCSADIFARVQSCCPQSALRKKTVVVIGCGGSRQFVEELARCGVGRFVLIDGDVVALSNLATQQAYLCEVGCSKVEVLRDRLLDISPEAEVIAVPRFLDDSFRDELFERVVGPVLQERPTDVLICGCADSFPAQARAAALAMQYGSCYLAAQLYQHGAAAEIYFSYPGVTRGGCARCAMESRYRAYGEGYQNDVGSEGAAIFATSRVNALKGQIALMLLLYRESESSPYYELLDQVADRNFVMIRMRPDAGSTLHLGIFDEAFSGKELCFFDETVWIPQTPNEDCPLCGGAPDITALKGKLRDTRVHWRCRHGTE